MRSIPRNIPVLKPITVTPRALLVQHPSSQVTLMDTKTFFDAREQPVQARPAVSVPAEYRATPDSIARAKAAAAAERADVDAQIAAYEGKAEGVRETLRGLVAEHGLARVQSWLLDVKREGAR